MKIDDLVSRAAVLQLLVQAVSVVPDAYRMALASQVTALPSQPGERGAAALALAEYIAYHDRSDLDWHAKHDVLLDAYEKTAGSGEGDKCCEGRMQFVHLFSCALADLQPLDGSA